MVAGARIGWLAVAFAAVLACRLAVAPPAHAHSVLTSSEPSAGAMLDAAPAEAVLRFDEGARVTTIRLFDAEERRIDIPGPVDTSVAGEARVALPDLPPGRYTLEWRALSADGHPIHGTIPFAIAAGAVR